MQINWNDNGPIYLQLKERLVDLVLEGVFKDEGALPSVRQVSSEYRINPITVSRAFQLLVDDDLVEKRRGVGMFVKRGARQKLTELERERFLNEDWPRIVDRVNRLGINVEQLISRMGKSA